jgi:hypothetical protein
MIASTSSEGAERAGQYEPQNQRVCVRIHAYTCMYIRIYIYIHECMHACIRIYIRTHTLELRETLLRVK